MRAEEIAHGKYSSEDAGVRNDGATVDDAPRSRIIVKNLEAGGLRTAKDVIGKPRLSLVPPGIIEAVGIIRDFGTRKYHGDPDNWREVPAEQYRDALMRHLVAYLRDPEGVDSESGYPHLWHMATNAAFLIEIEMKGEK